MQHIQAIRGMHDLQGDDIKKMHHIEQVARLVAQLYDFEEIRTPLLEPTEVFARTLGDTADIVTKEMYTFTDRNGDSLTLRPEGTAPFVRAFLSQGWQQHLPMRAWYTGAMFRHERPQKGRLRQFHQVGFEMLGESEPHTDADIITIAMDFLQRLGVKETSLELNTLGDKESREKYHTTLRTYMAQHEKNLSKESQARLHKNPLRILDSKEEADKEIIAHAPTMEGSRTPQAQDFFHTLCTILKERGINYTLNPKLVRGLDYYTHTVFEITSKHLGAQATVLAGGRYDGLIEQMGGKGTPAIGFACGIERLALLIPTPNEKRHRVAIIPTHTLDMRAVYPAAQEIRKEGITVVDTGHGEFAKQLKRANKLKCTHAVLIATGIYTLKDMETGTQQEMTLKALLEKLKETAP